MEARNRKILHTSQAPEAVGPYVQAVQCQGFIFTSGQIPLDAESNAIVGKDIKEQTEQVCKNLSAVLAAAKYTLADVIKTTCFLADMADFTAFNTVYEKHFSQPYPARSCIAARELPKGVRVEIEAVAIR